MWLLSQPFLPDFIFLYGCWLAAEILLIILNSFCSSSNLGDDGSPAAVLGSSEQESSYSALSTGQLDPGK